jgi:hypothetical protein
VPKFLNAVDLSQFELQNARVQNLPNGSLPTGASAVKGLIAYDSTNDRLVYYNGSTWVIADGSSLSYGAVTAETTFGASSSNGSATTVSRSDHQHGNPAHSTGQHVVGTDISAGAPGSSAVGDSVNNGTATTVARSDHRHGREAFAAVTAQTSFGASAANGTATTIPHSDHVHGTPTHDATAHSAIKISDLAAPTATVSFNSQRISNLADPSADTDAANKQYVDGVASGLDVKGSVRAASTANVSGTYNATGGTSGRGQFTAMTNTLDGISLAATNRVLLKDQSTGAQNGIWVVTTLGTGANGVWDRATDFDADAEVTAGAFTFVEQGTTNADSGWVLTADNPITIGGASGTALVWAQFSGAGQITAGAGLTKSGNTINAVAGSGGGLVVNADDIVVDTAIVVRKYATDIGDGAATSYVVTHNLGTRDVLLTLRDNSSPYAVMYPDFEATSTTTCTLRFGSAPTASQYRAVVHA